MKEKDGYVKRKIWRFRRTIYSETLMNAVIELEEAYEQLRDDPDFKELNRLGEEYAGRPSLLYYAEKMTKDLGSQNLSQRRT